MKSPSVSLFTDCPGDQEEVAGDAVLPLVHAAERRIEGIEAPHMLRKGRVKRLGGRTR
jgi:hypothetical protein